jgi:hypothetical protein
MGLIKSPKTKLLGPFAVLFIVAYGGTIVIQFYKSFFGIKNINQLVDISWIVASFAGLFYSIISLREMLKQGTVDKLLYYFVAGIFVVMICAWIIGLIE